jgi:hypothetical protein
MSTVPPAMRGLPPRSGPAGASVFTPELMHGELDCKRRPPSMNSGVLVMLPKPAAGWGMVQQ